MTPEQLKAILAAIDLAKMTVATAVFAASNPSWKSGTGIQIELLKQATMDAITTDGAVQCLLAEEKGSA